MALRTILVAAAAIWTAATPGFGASQYSRLFTYRDSGRIVDPVLEDKSGLFYGGSYDGLSGPGALYAIRNDSLTGHARNLVHAFCSKPDCKDGSGPVGRLVLDAKGRLYGTTLFARSPEHQYGGSVYRLVPDRARIQWRWRKLYEFCSGGRPCADGEYPKGLTHAGEQDRAAYDGASPLYGATTAGGAHDAGTLFKLTPPAHGHGAWTRETLVDFCADACEPHLHAPSAVIADGEGNLFGGAPIGNFQAVYEYCAADHALTILHQFCQEAGCSDGIGIGGRLVRDAQGNLFGTTFGGGNQAPSCGGGCGTIFELSPGAEGWTFATLHKFCAEGGQCVDGAAPVAPLSLSPEGDIFGVTSSGGSGTLHGQPIQGGVAYRLSGGSAGVLYRFCAKTDCADGVGPAGGMLRLGTGALIGNTLGGGKTGWGTFFKLVP